MQRNHNPKTVEPYWKKNYEKIFNFSFNDNI